MKEFVDGVETAPLTIFENCQLDSYCGGIIVADGAHLDLTGTHQGSLTIEPGGSVSIQGTHQGSLHIRPTGRVELGGFQQGSSHVDAAAELVVSHRGKLQGSLHNAGDIKNAGTRGGPISGPGTLKDLPGSRVLLPTTRHGITTYDWQ